MKGRAFVALVLSVLLLLLALGAGGWWLVWQRGPLQLAHQPLNLPRTARFVPASASFSLYLFSDGERPVAYARAVAPARQRRRAAEAVARLRDGAFAAAGLDYRQELAGWLAPELALALFEDPLAATRGETPLQPARGWLLALSSRDDAGARRFLQRFWQTRSLAGTDLQVSSYRGMGLISGRGALLGSRPMPLATALVDDDLVLIASGRNLLERALDASQIDALNQAGQPQLKDGLASFPQGAALMLASPQALRGWMGLPEAVPVEDSGTALLAVLQPQGRTLGLGARLALREPMPLQPLAVERTDALLATLRGSPSGLALLQDPAALADHPLLGPWTQAWLGPTLGAAETVQLGDRSLPGLVAAAMHGPLLVSGGPQGWLLGGDSLDPGAADLAPQLSQAGLIQAPLEVEGSSLQAWTRLTAAGRSSRRGDGPDQLEASLAGWLQAQNDQNWWGQNLAQLHAPVGSRELLRLRQALAALAMPSSPWQWGLDAAEARDQLRGWQPWRLLSALAGGGLDEAVQGLAVAVDAPTDQPVLQWRAQLDLGS